jgi:hypothetical protein
MLLLASGRHAIICLARCSLMVDVDVALRQHDVTGEGMLMLECGLHQIDAPLLGPFLVPRSPGLRVSAFSSAHCEAWSSN